MLTDPFYYIDYFPRKYVSNHSRGQFYHQDRLDHACEEYLAHELERRKQERLYQEERKREALMDQLMMAEIREERRRLLEEKRRAAAAAERERRLQMIMYRKGQEEEARTRAMQKFQTTYCIRNDPSKLLFNPTMTTRDPICDGMTSRTTSRKEMPYQFTNPFNCQTMDNTRSTDIVMGEDLSSQKLDLSTPTTTRCETKTSTSIHAKAVPQKNNPTASIRREPLSLPVQVEDASDSECEDEFSEYIRNRRPRDGEWIEPVEIFHAL